MRGRFTLVASELHDALARVQHAASTDDDRPTLATIALQRRGDDLRLAASDTYRIALYTIDSAFDDDSPWGEALLPIVSVPAALAFLKARAEEPVEVSRDDALVSLSIGSDRLDVELVDAPYPDVDAVFPKDPPYVASFGSEFLAGLVKGARKGVVRLSLADPLAPAVFRAPASSFVELIMPVRENLTLDDATVPARTALSPRAVAAARAELDLDDD